MSGECIVILTGAGISKESGLDTFRDADGIWGRVSVEDVATPEGFRRDPARAHAFYNGLRRSVVNREVLANAAHQALARLEQEWSGKVMVVTQNIDDLHEQAGSHNVLHMHGELRRGRCTACDKEFPWDIDMSTDSVCPYCGRKGKVRPHIVWFGEVPLYMPEIMEWLDRCDLFLSIGTSGNVYPAAGFVAHVREAQHAFTVEANLEPSQGASFFHHAVYGPATRQIPVLVDRLLTAKDIHSLQTA